jgi:hypothetical protein
MSQVRDFRLALFGLLGLVIAMLLIPQTRWVVPAWTVDPSPAEAAHMPVTNTPEGNLVHALFRGGSPFSEPLYETQLRASEPLGITGRGVLARNLQMGYLVKTQSESASEESRIWQKTQDQQRQMRARVLLRLTETGEQDDPGNAFWPLRRAVALARLDRMQEAKSAVFRAAQGLRYDNYAAEEMRFRTVADPGGCGISPGAYSKVMHGAAVLLPDYAELRSLQFLTLRGKNLKDSLAMRLAWAQIGERMVNQHPSGIGNVAGLALITDARRKFAADAIQIPASTDGGPRYSLEEMAEAQRKVGLTPVTLFATAEAAQKRIRKEQTQTYNIPLWDVPYATGLALGALPMAVSLVASALATLLIAAYLPFNPGARIALKWGLGIAVVVWIESGADGGRYALGTFLASALFFAILAIGLRRVRHSLPISFGSVMAGLAVVAITTPQFGAWWSLLGVALAAALTLHDQSEGELPRWRVRVEVVGIFFLALGAMTIGSLLALPGFALGPFDNDPSLAAWAGRLALGGAALGVALAHPDLELSYRRAFTLMAAAGLMLLVGAAASATVEEYSRRTIALWERGDPRFREIWKAAERRPAD